MLRSWSRLGLAAFAAVTLMTAGEAQSVTTTFANDNAHDGNMFNIIGKVPLTVNTFDVHFDNTANPGVCGTGCSEVEVEVHRTAPNTGYKGLEQMSGSWTLIGSVQHTYTTAPGVGQPLNMPLNLVLDPSGTPSKRYGIYVTNSGPTNSVTGNVNEIILYTNSTIKAFENADLKIAVGAGLGYPFGAPNGVFSPRTWNGTVYYTAAGGCNSNSTSYCTAGVSASGCQTMISSVGNSSSTAANGFLISGPGTEGNKSGLFYWGTVQKNPANMIGTSSSWNCVLPPVKRSGLLTSGGTNGLCDGLLSVDLNVRWTAQPAQKSPPGTTLFGQFWYRDPQNTSNQTTSRSDGLTWTVCP